MAKVIRHEAHGIRLAFLPLQTLRPLVLAPCCVDGDARRGGTHHRARVPLPLLRSGRSICPSSRMQTSFSPPTYRVVSKLGVGFDGLRGPSPSNGMVAVVRILCQQGQQRSSKNPNHSCPRHVSSSTTGPAGRHQRCRGCAKIRS